ncbi:hypothetical protein IQ249_19300 [Lusitaniella coriacea LEGE 07157]|uniref:Uncharacterized protein n=1 Tax=Lusitaniella coriacea LEGE 07157 TaxID=945747 RepID=A0A8J7E1V6_9CYAN|nr:hypothetical protein [Lusitaniella coriacea]MBE9118046.1 hypothetical protein [Lusitaniella coriacea LEGE 07157]
MKDLEMERKEDFWVNYVIGRPNMRHFEAKELLAQEWRIHYQAIYAGYCTSDFDKLTAEAYENANQKYLVVLKM